METGGSGVQGHPQLHTRSSLAWSKGVTVLKEKEKRRREKKRRRWGGRGGREEELILIKM